MSAVPKDRTESPALILAGRPPTRRLSTTPPRSRNRPDPAKKEEDDEDAETRRRILQRKKERKAHSERNLGTVVLSDSDSDDDDSEQDRNDAKKKIKVNPFSSPPQAKPKTKVVSIPTSSKDVKTTTSGGRGSLVVSAEDDEIAQLRAEIAALKRQHELAELRRERDELAKLTGLKTNESRKEAEARVKRKSPELEEEEREVAGLLVVGNKGGAGKAEREQKKLRTEGGAVDRKGKGKQTEYEEVVLSDSSE
jgi:hypothetical protein